MKKPIWIVLGVVIVLIGIRIVMGLAPQDDKKLIKEALAESIKASREGRPGGVMDKISTKLTVNNEQFSRSQIANVIRDSKPEIEVTQQDPVVMGDEAQITSPVRLKLSAPIGKAVAFDGTIKDVTLIFAKESATDWLIIPTTKWRLKEVKLPDDAMSQLSSSGGFGGFGGFGL
jgi:uncharacterized protein YjeT (DUF2065 family)